MNILIRYLAYHDDLAAMSMKLWEKFADENCIDVQFIPSDQFAFYAQYDTCCADADIVFQIDEDCFIYRPQSLLDIAKYMIDNKLAYIGPQEISLDIRKNCKNVAHYYINSFFWAVQPRLIGKMPPALEIANFEQSRTFIEPYWNIIGYLRSNLLLHEYIKADTYTDGISTILSDFEGKPFCIHTWFARLWDQTPAVEKQEGVPGNKKRIENALEYAICQSK